MTVANPAIPADKFELELTPAKINDVIKAAQGVGVTTGAGAIYRVLLDNIREIPGFNPRIESPDYLAHIDALASSIQSEGYYPDKPLAGYAGKDGDDAVIFLTDGYSRRRALLKLKEAGAEVASQPIPIILKQSNQNLEDLTVALVRGNDGRPMTPMEKGIVAKRLKNMGVPDEKIAERLGFTKRYFDDLMLLTGASAKVRQPVISGKISATEAVRLLRADASTAGDKVAGAVKTAEAAGKTKATGKDVKKASGDATTKKPKAEKKAADAPATPTQEMNTVVMTKKSVNGKVHHFVSAKFKRGHIADTAVIKPIRSLLGGTFWDYVDEKTDKEHVVFNHDLTANIEIIVPDEDDTFADAVTSSVPSTAGAEAKAEEKTSDETAGADAPDGGL